jgi:DNA-binding transcriptional ArsR family regulator
MLYNLAVTTRRPERVITDPKAIRALAHPARITVLSELSGGRTVTATEFADLIGLTPSAMSYHLRALERFGMIERAPAAADGRERRWRAVSGGWRIESEQPAITAPAEAALVAGFLDLQRREVLTYVEAAEGGPWSDAGQLSRSVRWLTPAQLAEVAEILRAAIDSYPKEEPSEPGTRAVSITQTVVPLLAPKDRDG